MNVRCYRPEDIETPARIFTESVQASGRRDYSPQQIAAWASNPPDMDKWDGRPDGCVAFVAEHSGGAVGFITFERNGHLDHLYVHSRFNGKV